MAARLAILGLALTWLSPSSALANMRLNFDGPVFRRDYVLFGNNRYMGGGSAWVGLGPGQWISADWEDIYSRYQGMLGQVGEALAVYVEPNTQTCRPVVLNALFLSLWWYHQACREPSDQMAIVKFAASMDALAGGKGKGAIINFIDARLGFGPAQRLMIDGSTSTKVVEKIYDAGRSRLVHGSSSSHIHDWSGDRQKAEALGRLCILSACEWMENNPSCDNLKAMSLK